MNKYDLRNKIAREEFSYQSLMVALKNYKAPLQKINELLKAKQIIRVKKGLYVIQPDSQNAFNPFVLANKIYGPSYISFSTALSYWGLIPERVESIESVTSKRNKNFHTPVGHFVYRYLNVDKYKVGIVLQKLNNNDQVFIASPEKAITDYINLSLKTEENMTFIDLLNDLRIDKNELVKIVNIGLLRKIVKKYNNKLCFEFLTFIEDKK